MNHRLFTIGFSSLIASGAFAETLALYTGEEGVVGEPVSELVNKINPGTFSGTAYQGGNDTVGYGNMPTYVDTVSGNSVYSDSFCTQMVAKVPLAIDFSTQQGAQTATGGYVDLANLATTLAGKKKFTFEFFWRAKGGRSRSTALASMYSGLQLRASTSYEYQGTPAIDGNYNKTWRMPGLDGSWEVYLDQLGWRHWAITYDADTKVAQLYFDYQPCGALTNGCVNGNATFPHFRLGARAFKATDNPPVSAFARGQMTCFRVSDTILSTNEFLTMGTSVFYPFKDGAAGTTVSTVTNALVAGTFTGVAEALNRLPTFDADRPGKFIFASSARDRVLAEDPQSVHFGMMNSWTSDSAWIAVTNLAGRILTGFAERYSSAVTVEMFFKKQHEKWGNLNFLSFNPGLRINLLANDATVAYAQQDQDTSDSSYDNEGDSFTNDDTWHHLAVVFTRQSASFKNHKNVDIYVDYAKADDQKAGSIYYPPDDYRTILTDKPLFIGHDCSSSRAKASGFMGRIAAFRILPRALTPAEFMVAADTTNAVPSEAGFRWRFEDGPADATVAQATDALSGEAWATGRVRTFGAEAKTKPAYAGDRMARRLVTGGETATNRLSAVLAAQADTNRVYVETRVWNGLSALHPKSWTLEALFKPDAGTRTQDVLLVGRGRLNPKTGAQWCDLALVLQPDGRLGFKGRRVASGAPLDCSYVDLGGALADLAWHAVAVAYDGDTRKLVIWADGAKVLDTALESELVDSSKGRYQIGGGCGQGAFAGKIDEVRLTAGVKAESDLQQSIQVGFFTIVH